MDDKWMMIGFIVVFLATNVAIFEGWIIKNFTLVNIPLVLVFILLAFANKKMNEPKSLLDSYKIGKQFLSEFYYGDKKHETMMDVLEVSREKDFIRDTKKGVVHDIVAQDKNGKTSLLKDDAYLRKNPASIVFMGKLAAFKPKFYDSKAEIERELKPIVKEVPRGKKSTKVKIERKETTEPPQIPTT